MGIGLSPLYDNLLLWFSRSEQRQFVPAVEQYFEDAMMAADPANQIEDAYKYVCCTVCLSLLHLCHDIMLLVVLFLRDVNKPGWQWRALRLLSRKSRHLFEQTQTPARKIPDYLEDIMRKLAKEITVCIHINAHNKYLLYIRSCSTQNWNVCSYFQYQESTTPLWSIHLFFCVLAIS